MLLNIQWKWINSCVGSFAVYTYTHTQTYAQTDTYTDDSGAKESECSSHKMFNLFRHGAVHKSKALHRKLKWEHKQQHAGRHTGTKLISHLSRITQDTSQVLLVMRGSSNHLSTPGAERDMKLEPESDTQSLPPAENGWALSHIQNGAAPTVFPLNPIWSHFRSFIVDISVWSKWAAFICGQSTNLMALTFGLNFKRG